MEHEAANIEHEQIAKSQFQPSRSRARKPSYGPLFIRPDSSNPIAEGPLP